MALTTLTQQVGNRNVKINSPGCPPYDYCRERSNGEIKHLSHRLLPGIGERYSIAMHSIGEVIEPLTSKGVSADFELWTYTGSTGNPDHLVDLGPDVIDHYRQNGGISVAMTALRSCAKDADEVMRDTLPSYGVNHRVVSIEEELGDEILDITKEFKDKFPKDIHQLDQYGPNKELNQWLSQLDVKVDWLMFFEKEERRYRAKQGVLTRTDNPNQEPVVAAALKEGLLYLEITKKARENGSVIVDLETTKSYMIGSLRHHPGPVIMANPYNPDDPESKLFIRQPFNTPVNL
jgi:hypothetical protein